MYGCPSITQEIMVGFWNFFFKTHQNFATNSWPPFSAPSEVCRGLWRNVHFRGEYLPQMELSERVNGIFGIPWGSLTICSIPVLGSKFLLICQLRRGVTSECNHVITLFCQTFSIPAATDSSSGPQTQVPVTSPGPGPDTGEKRETASQKVSVTSSADTVRQEENDFTRN